MTRRRAVFVYPIPWGFEYVRVEAGATPSHRLFYAQELAETGIDVRRPVEPSRLRLGRWSWAIWSNLSALALCFGRRSCIVGVQENAVYLALVLRRLRLCPWPVIVTNVALLKPENKRGIRRLLWCWLLGRADAVVSYSSDQAASLTEVFGVPAERSHYVPLGIATGFYGAAGARRGGTTILAAGNPGRDYSTLVRAVAELPDVSVQILCLDDVRAQLVADFGPLPPNVAVEPGTLSYAELTSRYESCAFVVLPLAASEISAGQTTLLEALIHAVPVIATHSASTVDYRDYVRLVPAGDVWEMRCAIMEFSRDPYAAQELGQRGAAAVRSQFTAKRTAQALADVLHAV